MAKETNGTPVPLNQSPSFARFILWEILGIVGFLHILVYGTPNEQAPLLFLANAVVFVATFPVLYYYKELKIPAVLKVLLLPMEYALRVILLVCGFLWITYILYAVPSLTLTVIQTTGPGPIACFGVVKDFWMLLVPLYVVDYLFFLEHLWGLSRVNFTFWASLAMISDGVSGVVVGLFLGRTLITKWGMFLGPPVIQGVIWMNLILLGVSVVVWFGNKTRKG